MYAVDAYGKYEASMVNGDGLQCLVRLCDGGVSLWSTSGDLCSKRTVLGKAQATACYGLG